MLRDVPTQPSRSARRPGRPPPPEVHSCYPAPPTRPARNHRPSRSRRGAHRGSASRASPGGSLSRSARQFLEPHLCLLRLSAHGCSRRRVALLVAFRAPPPERPRAHWPAGRPLSALIGPSCLGAGTSQPRARGAGLWAAFLGLDSALISNPIGFFVSLAESGDLERNPKQFTLSEATKAEGNRELSLPRAGLE